MNLAAQRVRILDCQREINHHLLMNGTDSNLLTRIANGDKAAVSECVDRYGGLLFALASRFTRTEADAEDAVQDVFIELWKSAARFNPAIASEKTFVSMIARRRLIDRARRRKLDLTSANVDQVASAVDDVGRELEVHDEASKATAILDQLPGDQCKAIRLAIFGGLSHAQIAAVTGLSLGTVKTHIRRGLNTIRQRLGIPSTVKTEGGVA